MVALLGENVRLVRRRKEAVERTAIKRAYVRERDLAAISRFGSTDHHFCCAVLSTCLYRSGCSISTRNNEQQQEAFLGKYQD